MSLTDEEFTSVVMLTVTIITHLVFTAYRVYSETEDTTKVFAEVKPLLTSLLDG